MSKKCPLPPDWKKHTEEQFQSYPSSYHPVMTKIIGKKETTEATETVWGEMQRYPDAVPAIMAYLIFLASTTDHSQWYEMMTRSRAEWQSLVEALKTIRRDDRIPRTQKALDELLSDYREQASSATNRKKKDVRQRHALIRLWDGCRKCKIMRRRVKVVSPLMRATFGPTWTEAYTKRRASEWGITKSGSEKGQTA